MSLRNKYLALFGLNEHATTHDIKKAYRKLVKKYHPDKNSDPRAHQIFLDLTQAYELLIENNFTVIKKNKTNEDRVKDAEIRLKQQQERKKQEDIQFFNKLTQGVKWRIYKTFAISSVLCSLLICLDLILPKHFEKHTVTAYSPKYNGLVNGSVRCLKTNKGLELFIKNPYPIIYSTHPEIKIERSWFFYNPLKIWHETSSYRKSFDVDFSVLSLFPFVSLIFILPIIPLFYKQRTVLFSIIYLFNFNLISIALLYFLFTQDRIIHLLSLGFI